MPQDARYDFLKLEYQALRAEILQSIGYQHQILLSGYGGAGLYFSYVLTKTSPDSDYSPALIAVPYILIGMTAMWVIECNRMVRAGCYIGGILWPAVKTLVDEGREPWRFQEWELWIRSKTDLSLGFRKRQHDSQRLVVLYAPIALSVISAFWACYRTYVTFPTLLLYQVICMAIAACLWWRIWEAIHKVSDLGATIGRPSQDLPTVQPRPNTNA